MPWSEKDVDDHYGGLNPEQKALWVRIANSILEKNGDEGRAIREANAVVNRAKILKK